ncbi:MAG: hypothetical protein Q9M91_00235 [Candidatus Dojkabacteria bacterium]|nr:hypothetical protein [Candidatus Dojkabacteria bacterium]MDQ7020260.1 hypothetical protein [Candidatus Dojkabacteria bacterium]
MDLLENKIINIFSKQDEIFAIDIYGKGALSPKDKFSDIDLFFYSTDLHKSYDNYLKLLENNGLNILFNFQYPSEQINYISGYIVFKNQCFYQKLDYNFVHSRRSIPTMYIDMPIKNIYMSKNSYVHSSNPSFYLPKPSPCSVQTQESIYLNSIAFCKCHHRSDLNVWTYWNSLIEIYLELLIQKYSGWDNFSRGINKSSRKNLREKLSTEDKLDYVKILNVKNFNIKKQYILCVESINKLLSLKAYDLFEFYSKEIEKELLKNLANELY